MLDENERSLDTKTHNCLLYCNLRQLAGLEGMPLRH